MAPDSSLQVLLHPLVLLTISDHVTRHVARQQQGPIVGALLGQHYGREIRLEYAFECNVTQRSDEKFILNDPWFEERLQQYKDVHKAPQLELVGWFTTAPMTGPEASHVPIHQHILDKYNETALLLAFHPSEVLEGAGSAGGKLPLTIYESFHENVKSESQNAGQDPTTMEIEGQDISQDSRLELRFRELPYTVETGEAEMIGVDFIARGGGTAAADTDSKSRNIPQGSQDAADSVGIERRAGKQKEDAIIDEAGALSPENEECTYFLWFSKRPKTNINSVLSSLSARANAIKMLHTRLGILKSYLSNLPPSYLTTATPTPPDLSLSDSSPSTSPQQFTEVNHPILRSIKALLTRLNLLVPSDQAAFEHDRLVERSDVSLVDLLSHLTTNVKDTKELGRKFGAVEQARMNKKGHGAGAGVGAEGEAGTLASASGTAARMDDFMLPSEKAQLLATWSP